MKFPSPLELFLQNYDVIQRKPQTSEHTPLYENAQKREKHLKETTDSYTLNPQCRTPDAGHFTDRTNINCRVLEQGFNKGFKGLLNLSWEGYKSMALLNQGLTTWQIITTLRVFSQSFQRYVHILIPHIYVGREGYKYMHVLSMAVGCRLECCIIFQLRLF